VSPVLFDTLKLTRALREKARFTQEQAEGLTDALSESFEERVATKQDIANLEAKLESLEQRLTVKMGGMLVVAVGLLTGALKEANVAEDKAAAAAEEAASFENWLASLEAKLSFLTWMAGANITLTLLVLGIVSSTVIRR